MFSRILIAALAVYVVHHNDTTPAALVTETSISATRLAVDLCLEQPLTCQTAVRKAASMLEKPSNPQKADLLPVDLPLPPRRETAKRT